MSKKKKIPQPTSVHFATSVRSSRVRSSELISPVSSREQQHPKCERAIRLVYPPFLCKPRSSSKPQQNKNLTELYLEKKKKNHTAL